MTEQYVRPDVAGFLAFMNMQQGPQLHEVTPEEGREMMRVTMQIAEEPLGDLAIIRDIQIPGSAGDIPARIFDSRDSRGPGPVMVFYHGGGFVIGDLDVYAPYCAQVARQMDMPVISVDYRLAPEHPFPAAPQDCETAARWIAQSPQELGYNVTGMILFGDSAGGNMTIVTAMALRDNPAAVPVLAQYPIYPLVSDHNDWQSYTDFAQGHILTKDSMDWFMDLYAPVKNDPRHAPLNFSQEGMPPTVIVTASLDPLRDQGIAYHEKLLADGVPSVHISADGNVHGHITIRKAIPSSQEDMTKSLSALRGVLSDILVEL